MKLKMNIKNTLLGLIAGLLVLAAQPVLAQTPNLNETQKLVASDAAAGDLFGHSVAISGDTAVVASLNDDAGLNIVSAYVYVRSGGIWTEQAKLTAAAGDQFGSSVAISGDTVIVGARLDDAAGSQSGSAYVFVRSGGTWTEQTKLTASDAALGDLFGISVAISGDTVIVGAARDDDGASNSGSAYAFVRSAGAWTEQAKLTASDAASGDWFGDSVAISGDTAVVGARFDDDGGSDSGSAYVFVRSASAWTEQAKLTAFDAVGHDWFGDSVAISGDTIIVGAWQKEDDEEGFTGSAYVFVRSGGTWTEQTKLTASDAADGHSFGRSVAIRGDTAIVGAPGDDGGGRFLGSAYVFVRSGGTWTEQAKLTASDAADGDFLGISVATSGDTAIVGALGDDDGGSDSGSAYVFTIASANTAPTADAGPDQSIRAGDTVDLDGSGSDDDNTASASLVYSWTFTLVPMGSIATLTGADTATPSFVADVSGDYIVKLEVTDEGGLTSQPDYVTVGSNNLAPTAAAGNDQLVIVGNVVNLDGSDSSDPDGDFISYSWSLDAPMGSAATLSSADMAMPSFTPDVEGTYLLTLAVSDFIGPGLPDAVEILATSASGFAENRIVNVNGTVDALIAGQVTTGGNQEAFGNFLSQAIAALQNDDVAKAIDKLEKAIERTDGCALRGSPDGNGNGRDWITDCEAQAEVYGLLTEALNALTSP